MVSFIHRTGRSIACATALVVCSTPTQAQQRRASGVPAPLSVTAARCAASTHQLLAAVREVHDRQSNVGVQSAIHLSGRLVFSGNLGWADRDRNLPVTRTTRFPIASVTKAFAGVATLQAAASGRLNLDAPIQTYVPEFPVKPELTITPRRLAAHRAGIRHWGPERDGLFTRRFDRLARILPLFAADPLLANAGSEYQYSSYGYNLLGLAVERATGTNFTRSVERQIIRPLALSRTSFDDARRPVPELTKLYSAFDLTRMTPEGYAELPAGTPLTGVPARDYSHNMAGGNMSSTAEDLVRFGGALLRPGFLSRREHDMLFRRPQFAGGPSPMSFGFFASAAGSERRLSISGANPGIMAALMIYPERDLTVAVLANSWGYGARSGDMTDALPKRLADLCSPVAPHPKP